MLPSVLRVSLALGLVFDFCFAQYSQCPVEISGQYCLSRIDRCSSDASCSAGTICCYTGCYRECIVPRTAYYGTTRGGSAFVTGPKPGICPTAQSTFRGSCTVNCNDDSNCQGSQKCCFNGCGQECMYPINSGQGTASTSCVPNPCPFGQVCVVGSGSFQYECKLPKLGNCPSPSQVSTFGAQCTNDFDPTCSTTEKCCSSFSGQYCTQPIGQFGGSDNNFGTNTNNFGNTNFGNTNFGNTNFGGQTQNCPLYQTYSTCSANPSCQRSCDTLTGPILCSAVCTPGCVCAPGYVLRTRFGTDCIPVSQCPGGNTNSLGGGITGVASGSETIRRAVAVFRSGRVNGEVFFTQPNLGQPLQITGTLTGLTPNAQHGFHVHSLGDLTSDCASAGEHFNPYGQTHGGRDSAIRHVGDFGNIAADSAGRANINFSDRVASLNGLNSVIGRALIIKDGQDDLGVGGTSASQTTGNAGGRMACAIIGIQESTRFLSEPQPSNK